MTPLSDAEIEELLDRKDRWVTLSSYDPQGFPHSVPMGYFRNGPNIVMGCRDGTQKVLNIERESRCSVLWENGRGADSLTGILIRGHARVVRDDGERRELKAEACRQRGVPAPESLTPGAVYIEVVPSKITSWTKSVGT